MVVGRRCKVRWLGVRRVGWRGRIRLSSLFDKNERLFGNIILRLPSMIFVIVLLVRSSEKQLDPIDQSTTTLLVCYQCYPLLSNCSTHRVILSREFAESADVVTCE